MSREIDERLVAMRFDNSQFEEGVKESLASLAALREGLDLDGAADSFNDVYKASEKYLKFDEPTKSANAFRDSLSRIGQIGKAAFSGLTAPLKSVGNVVNGLYKDMTRLFGLDIAYNLEQSAIKTLRAFTTEPLTTGFQEYETKVDSIRAIMNSTIESYTKKLGGVYDADLHRADVKQKIEDLNKYADKTIYSFSDMMRSLPTLTNMGVDIDQAVSTVKGLHNLAAVAGKGAAEASRALFNLGDAFSIGHFEAKDWKTMEYAGLATPEFKKIAIQMAEKNGSLILQAGKLYAKEVSEKGTEKLHEVTVENFKDTLRYDWFDKKTLEDTFKIYSGNLTVDDLIGMGFDKNKDQGIINYLINVGNNAMDAATQVRTFSKMMDALKEAAQSGWSQSYEHIFGDDEEATKFWTGINNAISNTLDNASKKRNEMLKEWSEEKVEVKAEDGGFFAGENGEAITSKFISTRDALQNIINSFVAIYDMLKKSFGEAWENVFGKLDGKKLAQITGAIRDFMVNFTRKGIRDNLPRITKALEGFFTVLKVVGGTVKDVFTWVGDKFGPIFKWLFDAFIKVGEFLGNKFKGAKNLKDVFDILRNGASGNVKQVLDWFAGIPDKISSKWEEVKNWYNNSSLKGIVDTVWDGIIHFFSAPEGDTSTFDKMLGWLKQAYDDISAAWQSVVDWWNNPDNMLHNFLNNVWNGILNFFKAPEDSEDKKSGFDNLIGWLKRAYEDVSGIWEQIKAWWEGSKLKEITDNIWSGIISFFTPQTKTVVGKQGNTWTEGESPFTSLIAKMGGWIETAKTEIQTKWNELKSWWDGDDNPVRNIAENIWSGIVGFFTPGENGESPFTSLIAKMGGWIETAKTEIQTKWNELKSWWDGDDNPVRNIAENIWSGIVGFFTAPEDSETGESGFSSVLSNLQSTWVSIRDWGGWAEISAFVGDSGLGGKIRSGLTSFFAAINRILNPDTVAAPIKLKPVGLLAGAGASDVNFVSNPEYAKFDEKDSIVTKFMNFVERMKTDWETAKTNMDELIKDIPEKIDSFRQTLSKFFGGDGEDSWDEIFDSAVEDVKGLGEVSLLFSGSSLLSGLGKFFKGTGQFEKYLGKATYKETKEGHTFGGILSTFVKRITTPFSGAYSKKGRKSISGWIENFKSFEGATDFKSTSGKVQDFATAAIEFAGALWIIVDAFNRIAEMTKDETIDFEKSGIIVAQLAALIGAFEIIAGVSTLGSHSYFGSFTGLIGFAFAIEAELKAFKSIIDVTKNMTEGQINEATILIEKMGTMVTVFTGVNNLSTLGYHTGTFGSAAGLVGFTHAITTLVNSFKEIIMIVAADEFRKHDYDRAVGFIDHISGIIIAFTGINNLSMLGEHGSMLGASTGLIGFAYAIKAILDAFKNVLGITSSKDFDQRSFTEAGSAIGQIGVLVTAFAAINGNLGHSTLGSAVGIIGFAVTIKSMIAAIGQITDAYGTKGKESVTSAVDVLKELTKLVNTFSVYKGVGDLLGNVPSMFGINAGSGNSKSGSGLIGFAIAIEAMISAVGRIASIKDQGNIDGAVVIIDKLGWLIDRFQIFSGLKGLFIGAASQLNDKGKLKSPNGSSGIIGFVIAISGLVYDLSVLANIDSDKATKASEILQKMGEMINIFVGIDTLRQGANALTGFSGITGKAANVGKVIDFLAMEGFVGSIILLVDKIISVSKDTELNTDKVDAIVPVFETLGTIIGQLTTDVGAFELLSSLSGKFGTATGSGWATGAQAFVNLLEFVGLAGVTLWGVGAALKAAGITDEQLGDVAGTIHSLSPVITAITGELGALVGGFFGGAVAGFEGEKLNVATSSLDEAVTNLANVTEEDLAKLQTSISALNAINETLPNKTLWEAFTGTKMENFANGMKELGGGFAEFYSGVSFVTDWDAFTRAVEALKSVVALGTLVTSYATQGSQYGDAAYDLLHFFGVLSGVDSVGFNMTPGDIDSYTTIESIWNSFGANLAGSLVAGFNSKAEELATIITDAVDTNPTITPVLDLEQFRLDAAGMWNMLPGGINYNLAGANITNETTVDLDTVKELIEQHAADIDKITQTMADGLTFIGTMLGNISFEMDGQKVGDIVTPYVDANISVELARYLRQNGLME